MVWAVPLVLEVLRLALSSDFLAFLAALITLIFNSPETSTSDADSMVVRDSVYEHWGGIAPSVISHYIRVFGDVIIPRRYICSVFCVFL